MGSEKDGIFFQGPEFDPFDDRKSRNIRNRLSEAFILSLRQRKPELVEKTGRELIASAGGGVLKKYISDRLAKYQRVTAMFQRCSSESMAYITLCIWNEGLFFECHEYLEHYWLNATGEERLAMQALILSAGAFVHRTLGREVPARRLSARALWLVESSRERLSFIKNLEDLIAALQNQGADAPKLEGEGLL
jgi:hypothetical protein